MKNDDNIEDQEKDHSKNEDTIHDDPTKINIERDQIKDVPKTVWNFVKDRLSIKDEVDVHHTIRSIKSDIEFKGSAIWVLVCSTGIASIGLNVNSVAVIIGAMLISPLMGPIRGVGLSVGMADFKLLIKSLINLGVMVGISILVSWIYFLITPLKGETPELLARVKPHILDVLVACFGGMAGIIAASSPKVPTVVPGVAIATALMPPLCTAGYGLAIGDAGYFLGALYLFFLNSLLICLATIVLIRYLRFPTVQFVSKKLARKVKYYIFGFMLLILIPSGVIFYDVIQESIFKNNAEAFVEEVTSDFPGASRYNQRYTYKDEDGHNRIEVYMAGIVPEQIEQEWERRLKSYGLSNADLVIIDNEDENTEEAPQITVEQYTEARRRHVMEVDELKKKIAEYEVAIRDMESKMSNLDRWMINTPRLDKKLRFDFPNLKYYRYSPSFTSDLKGGMDSSIVFYVKWDSTVVDSVVPRKNMRLQQFIRIDLEREDVYVRKD